MRTHEFENRVALVTGGSRGIGRAVALELVYAGARVAINYLSDTDSARETLARVRNAGGDGIVVRGDVSNAEDVQRVVDTVRGELGSIEFLVNNAGLVDHLTHDQLTFPVWKKSFEVNVDGPFLTTWAVKNEMIERNFGRIVNSLAGVVPKIEMLHYATAKAALIAFTRNCGVALAPFNVRVNSVAPGLTDTDRTAEADATMVARLVEETPLRRMADPGEIASVVAFLLSERAAYITGETILAAGGRG
jgi:NAD(P)-dependent dehydrogenase (short-subunit alcohol dehydrogenase family)